MDELDAIFDNFDENKIFNKKEFLQTNYTPETIPHREEKIKQIASILAPALRGEKTSNLFLYGNTGTGKTLSILRVKEALEKRVHKSKDSDFELVIKYLNCKMGQTASTEYRILAELIKLFGEEIPETGLPTQTVHNKFRDVLDSKKQLVILILDEIDQLVKKMSDNFLYNLTRLNSELLKSQISFVGISNDLTFLDNVDSRVKSSLSEEDIIFDPYKANQILDILLNRVEGAFKENVLEPGVVQKCAAYAVKDSGDARRALDLIRVAGELAERSGANKVIMENIDEARNKIEKDKILDVVHGSSQLSKLILNSIINLNEEKGKLSYFTGDIYNDYKKYCNLIKNEPVTQRRVGDIIQEFDMLGIINFRVISKGRGGRMREIKLILSSKLIEESKKIIEKDIFG